jgi:hypothetical protein
MSRKAIWAQLVVGYGILEAALWTSGRAQGIASGAAAGWLLLCVLIQGRSRRELGIGGAGFFQALIALPLALIASAFVILIAFAAGSLRELHGQGPVWMHALGYVVWALFQQFVLQSFFYVSLEGLLANQRKAAWVTAGLFAAAHIPNPVLIPATFVGGLFFVKLFQRARNIYPLGLAHALVGLSLAISVPSGVIRNMRVGAAYLRFDEQRQLSSGQTVKAPQTWVEVAPCSLISSILAETRSA